SPCGSLIKSLHNGLIISPHSGLFKLIHSNLSGIPRSGLLNLPCSGLIIKPDSSLTSSRAFTAPASVPAIYIQQFWNTLTQEANTRVYHFQLDQDRFTLNASLLREALDITPIDQAHQFESPLQGIVTRKNVDYVELMWEEFVQAIQTFFADKADMGIAKKDKKIKPHVIPYCRFTKLIICNLGRKHNINQRNASYYNAYLEMVAKHDHKIAAEEGEKKKSAAKANQSKKPTTAKQPKPVSFKQSKPAPAKQPKPVKEKSIKPSPVKKATKDQYIFQRRIPVTENASIGPSTQLEDDTSANIVRDTSSPTDAETCAETDKTNKEKTAEIDEGQARSDPVKHLTLAGSDPEPMHDDFVATVYPQFFNDKPTEKGSGKTNMETKVKYMVTVMIHRAFSLVPSLSMPVIDLTPPKPVSSTTQAPIFTATTETTTTLPPPPPQQQSTTDPALASCVSTLEMVCANFEKRHKLQEKTVQGLSSIVFTLELRDLPHKIDQTVNKAVKEAVQTALQALLRERFKDLSESDMKEILHDWIFKSGTYRSHPEHVALYEALEASMDRDNRDEFLDIRKSKLSKADLEGPAYKVVIAFHSNSNSLQFHMKECHLLLIDQIDLVNPKGHRVVPDMSKPLSLGGPPGQ
nr:hypothetical protein [Tanacetum cinerariifolium]